MRRRIPVAVGLIVCGLAALVLASLFWPYRGFQAEFLLDIPRGTSTPAIARLLAENGVVRHPWQFLVARGLRLRATLQAGEYRFERSASAWEVLDRLVRGDVHFYELSIPEGYNLFDIAAAVENLGFISRQEFLAAAWDPSLIRDLAPKAPSLEGYLFPATYHVTRHSTAAQLCRQMTQHFREVLRSLPAPPAGRKLDVHALVTLASMVEKEASLPEERPLVASVFWNRLERRMPLDCDPTTIYASLLEGRYQGEIHRSDLSSRNPYNTYRRAGLPPGPIANPGLASLKAVLQPAQTDYLFFVARPDGSGGHSFSTKLGTHNRAVQQYRRGQSKGIQTRRAARSR